MLFLSLVLIIAGNLIMSGQVSLQQAAAQYYPVLVAHSITPAIMGAILLFFGLLLLIAGITRHVENTLADHVKLMAKVKATWDRDIPKVKQALTSMPNSSTLVGFIAALESVLFPSPVSLIAVVGKHKKKFLTLTRIIMVLAGVYSIYSYVKGTPSGLALPLVGGGGASIAVGSALDKIAHGLISGVSAIRNASFLNK